jgi:hypothetical protein
MHLFAVNVFPAMIGHDSRDTHKGLQLFHPRQPTFIASRAEEKDKSDEEIFPRINFLEKNFIFLSKLQKKC